MKLFSIIILGLLPSCVFMQEEGATFAALGGKGAYRKGVGVVYNNEKSFRDGAIAAAAITAGYFANATNEAVEATSQISNTNSANTAQKKATENAAVEITKSNNAVKMTEITAQ